MKITLLSTDLDVWALGLRSISAVLNAANHPTRLIFFPTQEKLLTKKTLNDFASLVHDADIVGVSCLAQGSMKAQQVCEFLHSRKKFVVWGGVHASLNPEECTDWADIVCRGEGEGMMLELLERLEQGRDWKDIENVAYKENGCLHMNDVRPPIPNLDELPLPDFSFRDEYHLTRNGFMRVSTLDDAKHRILFNSSRGCAFHCTYCCNVKIKNLYAGKYRYVRRMSVSKLIEHTQVLRKIFPQDRTIYFIDEDFGARPVNELIQLSEEFPKKIGLPFECLTHPSQVSHKKMDLLVKAGLYRLNMGIESGSEETRKEIYDRHVSNEVVKRATEIINDYPQVTPDYFFIIANPYEERSNLIDTVRLISKLPYICKLTMYNLVFFPGSFLYERAIQDQLIEGKQDSGLELDFLGGFNYQNHLWKQKNLYLNGVISLMDGRCTRYRIGILPRFLISLLLRPRLLEFFDNHVSVIKVVLSIIFFVISIRHLGGKLIRKILSSDLMTSNPRLSSSTKVLER